MVDDDVAVERVAAGTLGELDVRESDGAEAGVVRVGAAEIAVVVEVAGTNHRVADEEALAEVELILIAEVVASELDAVGRSGGTGDVGQEIDGANRVLMMLGRLGAPVVLMELHAHHHVHLGRVARCVGGETHVLLRELIVSVVSQHRRYSVALAVQRRHFERQSWLQQRLRRVLHREEMPQPIVVHHAVNLADGVALPRMHVVEHVHLLALHHLELLHLGLHVACVVQHLADVAHCVLRLHAVVEHWRLA